MPENFIEDETGRVYLIDWEYSAMNDPMWDLAALFLESNFRKAEEGEFFKAYFSEDTPVSVAKIMIIKYYRTFCGVCGLFIKKNKVQTLDLMEKDRYLRAVKNLKEYVEKL